MKEKNINPSTWHAVLKLNFKLKDKKTILYNKFHHGPLMVQRVFYPEEKICHVYLLHPPGGIVSGDSLCINAKFFLGTQVLMTTPGATKFYRSIGKVAYVNQNFYLNNNSSLEWLPQDNIIFPNANIQLNTQFYLKKQSKLFAWENLHFIYAEKKTSSNTGSVVTCLKIWIEKKLLLHERLRIFNNDMKILANHSLISIIIISPANKKILHLARTVIKKSSNYSGVTLLDHVLIIRLLDNDNMNMQITLRQLWYQLRPKILKVKFCVPRIWFT